MIEKITQRKVDGIIPIDKFDLMITGARNYENLSSYYNQCLLKDVHKPKEEIEVSTNIYEDDSDIRIERYNIDIDYDYLRFPSLFIYRETEDYIDAYFLDNSKWNAANIRYTFNKKTGKCNRSKHVVILSNDGVYFLEILMQDTNSKIYLVR